MDIETKKVRITSVQQEAMLISKLIYLTIEFIILFYILQAFGPVLDNAFSNWTGILASFGAIMSFLSPGPDDALLVIIEALLITIGTVLRKN